MAIGSAQINIRIEVPHAGGGSASPYWLECLNSEGPLFFPLVPHRDMQRGSEDVCPSR
jgi:hypothetical protein